MLCPNRAGSPGIENLWLDKAGVLRTRSVGIAPNVFLAKVASDCQKPDGLTIWPEDHLPDALFALKLTDLPGIGSAMKRRLNEFGVTTVEQLWNCSAQELRRVWHSVLGERWHWMLRGSQKALLSDMRLPFTGRLYQLSTIIYQLPYGWAVFGPASIVSRWRG